eukprot:COSAG06_NODE_66064_length_255_cov_0.743590_1_plen_46_part_10
MRCKGAAHIFWLAAAQTAAAQACSAATDPDGGGDRAGDDPGGFARS